MGNIKSDRLDKADQSLEETRQWLLGKIRVCVKTAQIIEQRASMPTVYGTLYGPLLNQVLEPSSVAHAVNPILSTPVSETKSAPVTRSSDYKGVLFKGREEDIQTIAPEEDGPRSPGLGGSSSGA